MSNPEVRGGQANHFPIAPPGSTTETFVDQLDDAVTEAVEYFENLSEGSAFSPYVGLETDGSYGSGHDVVVDKGQEMVAESIRLNESRWAGIGKQQFPPNTGESFARERYQVQRPSGTENLDQSEDGGTTSFTGYTHKTGQPNTDSQATGKRAAFWDSYFQNLGMVGRKITLGATGRDLPSDPLGLGSATSGVVKQGMLDESDLKGGYGKKDIKLTEAGEVFLDETGQPTRDFSGTRIARPNRRPLSNQATWGQMNSWADPFEAAAGFPIIENQGLQVSLQLLEIWSMVVLRLLVSTSLLQISSWLISVVGQGGLKGDDHLLVNWNRNYYPPNPREVPGNSFFKGSSGFNHPATDILSRGVDELSRFIASANGMDGGIGQGVSQLVVPAVSAGAKIIEDDILNLTVHVQRELNIYVPRHTLSTMANEVGYNSPGENLGETIGNKIFKAVDIYSAYVRAYTAGMATMVVTIAGQDYGKSLGFWKVLFRSVVRSKSQWGTRKAGNSAYENMLLFLGKDDKVMKFANYLARIGDLGVATGDTGNIAFPENKIKLDLMQDYPTLRTASTRKYKSIQSRLSLTDTPSLFLIPKNIDVVQRNLEAYGIEKSSNYASLAGENNLSKTSDEIDELIGNKFQASTENRFTPQQVRLVEDQLEAEHMPFYIQDLRTNEIISFHAFLTSLSDSYTGEWSAQKGFGRLEAAQIYGGGSRSIGVSFMMVPMNEQDFEEMWYKVNKLTTLVYPQWSEGTLMDSGDSTFIQPFSQVPTASPLCRLRVGDLFTSNYSKQAMARMMGVGNENFIYTEPGGKPPPKFEGQPDGKSAAEQRKAQIASFSKSDRHIGFIYLVKALDRHGFSEESKLKIKRKYIDNRDAFKAVYKEPDGEFQIYNVEIFLGGIDTSIGAIVRNKDQYLKMTRPNKNSGSGLLGQFNTDATAGLASLFRSEDVKDGAEANPIFKSFHSTMGRGIAVAITGITFDWKLNSIPWNLQPGHRAPRMCEVQLSVTPIHDITPGLDHQGINRAPIYKVGDMSKSLTGDVWYNSTEYEELTSDIDDRHSAYLKGEQKHLKNVPEDKK
ncbi:MAG: hypothetical protein CMM15_06470 [Rhodospirillaceae bacterium]|nr:hypothetical protein [Rhodospirillaceae bacterium]